MKSMYEKVEKLNEFREKSKTEELRFIGHLLTLFPTKARVMSLEESNFTDDKTRKAFVIIKNFIMNDEDGMAELYKLLTDEFGDINEFLKWLNVGNVENFSKQVRKNSLTLRFYTFLLESSEKITSENSSEFLSEFQKKLMYVAQDRDKEVSEIEKLMVEYSKIQELYLEKLKNGQELLGFSTGFRKLDQVIDGFRPEHLIVLGGYTNLGKTFLSLNFMRNAITQKKRVVFYSLEMSKTDLLSRLLGLMTGQNGTTILKGFAISKEFLVYSKKELSESKSSIYSEIHDLNEILLSMTEESYAGVDLFVLDYLQLVNVKGASSEYESIRLAVNAFQTIAKKLKVPIIILSQVSNEAARNSSSNVMGFKGSGSIAAAADLAIELVSGEESQEDLKSKLEKNEPINIKCIIKKNRHGRIGSIAMKFDGTTGLFRQDDEDSKAEADFAKFGVKVTTVDSTDTPKDEIVTKDIPF